MARGIVRAIGGTADQLLYSLTNFILTILVARYSIASTFGTFSVLVATFLVASAVNRGLTSEPLLIRVTGSDRTIWAATSERLGMTAVIAGCIGGAVLTVITAVALPSDFEPMGYIFAAAMPVLFLQDFVRYAALAKGSPRFALANDLTVFVVQVGASGMLVLTSHRAASGFIVAWAAAGAAGAFVGCLTLRIAPRPHRSGVPPLRDLAARLGVDNLVTQVTQQGTSFAVALLSGLAAAGGLRAAQTFFSPASILTLGVYSVVIAELARMRANSLTRMLHTLRVASAALVIANVLYLAFAIVAPDGIGRVLLGPSWRLANPLLGYIGAAVVFGALANMAVAGLRALEDASRILRARAAVIVLGLALVVTGAAVDGARGAAIGLAASTAAQVGIWWIHFRLAFREAQVTHYRKRVQAEWDQLLASVDPATAPEIRAVHRLYSDRSQQVSPFDAVGGGGILAEAWNDATVTRKKYGQHRSG